MSAWSLTGSTPYQQVVAHMGESDSDALSVSQAAVLAAVALHGVPKITVLGEVTGFRGPNARSGHCYFQIKDESAALEGIVWTGTYDPRACDLRDGLPVLCPGTFDLDKPTGKMSFTASSFTLAGEGLLRQQVAQRAEKLRREGLRAPAANAAAGETDRASESDSPISATTGWSGVDPVKLQALMRTPPILVYPTAR